MMDIPNNLVTAHFAHTHRCAQIRNAGADPTALWHILPFLVVSGLANGIAETYCFDNNIVMTEFDWIELHRWIFGISAFLACCTFSILFLVMLGDQIAYIRKITVGIDALHFPDQSASIPLEGNNELTELAAAINDMSATQRQIREKERVLAQEKEQLIRTLSHDIRTPLTSILAYSDRPEQYSPYRTDVWRQRHRPAQQSRILNFYHTSGNLEFFRISYRFSSESDGILSSQKQTTQNKFESEENIMTAFLDLLILVVMVLSAVSLLAMALIFLVKNKKVTRFCFYLVVALGIYMGYVGARINWPGFLPQVILAVLMALTGIGALALERLSKDSGRKLLIAKIAASIALVVGMFNAFA